MADRKLAFKCWHPDCTNDPPLEIVVQEPAGAAAARGTKQIGRYCERGHLNIITLPDTWDVRPLVLGEDDVIGEQDGIPVVQGRRL